MKIRKPDYYDRFQCIAGACSDSCCIGWEIDVDEGKRQMYREVGGELGERLRTCIDWEEGHFILQGKEERCPFLNQKNLCDLIIGLGEKSLCEICREHPRYYEWYDGLTEVGVGLCCEAAARLILESETPAGFIECKEESSEGTDGDAEHAADDPETLDVLFRARETAFLILQNRRKSIWSRLKEFLFYIEELQDGLDFGNPGEIEESAAFYRNTVTGEIEEEIETGTDEKSASYMEILEICMRLEPMDEAWPERLKELENFISDPEEFQKAEDAMSEACENRAYEYENIAVYFVYRYFMKCKNDGDIFSKGCLAVFCILLIRLLDVQKFQKDGKLTKEDRVQNAKSCSKEIEYSEENLDLLTEEFWERGCTGLAAGL